MQHLDRIRFDARHSVLYRYELADVSRDMTPPFKEAKEVRWVHSWIWITC
jgi:hypothetical protein